MLRVEIAETSYKQAQGLMFRHSMPEDSGMIFVFKYSSKLRFWGVNTYLPLDIAFVNRHGRIVHIAEIKPLSQNGVESPEPCCIAIEANLGYFNSNGIRVGDKIEFSRQTDRNGIVTFEKSIKVAQQIIDKPSERPYSNPMQNNQILTPNITPDAVNPVDNNTIAPTQENPQGLPVIDVSMLDGLLEDSYDETAPEETIDPQDTTEEPLPPEISPENLQTDEPPEPFPMDDEDYPDFSSPAEALTWAQQNHEVVHIWYKTKGGRDIERNVEPHGQFVASSTGNQIVVTFDQTIGDIRAFIIPNVLYFSFAGQEFQPKFVVKG